MDRKSYTLAAKPEFGLCHYYYYYYYYYYYNAQGGSKAKIFLIKKSFFAM